MKRLSARTRTLLAMIVVMVLVAACSRRDGVGWAGIQVVDEQQTILVAFKDDMAVLSRDGDLLTTDLEVSTLADQNNLWQIDGDDVNATFYVPALSLGESSEGDRMMLVADYNNDLLVLNFDRGCFSTLTGACVDTPFEVSLPGHVLAPMAQDDERVYVGLSEQDLMAFHKGVFSAEWDREDDIARRQLTDQTLQEAWETPFQTERGIWAQPLVIDGRVYVSGMDHNFYMLDAETGEELARLELGGAIAAAPSYYDGTDATDYADDAPPDADAEIDLDRGRFYVGTLAGRIYQVPLDFSGLSVDDLDYISTQGWVWNTPKIYDGVLYAGDLDGNLYAVDVRDGFGEVQRVSTDVGGIRARPVVTENYVIVAGRSGRVQWFLRDGLSELPDMRDTGSEILADMVLLPAVNEDDETLLLVSTVRSSRTLFAYTVEGAPRWRYPES